MFSQYFTTLKIIGLVSEVYNFKIYKLGECNNKWCFNVVTFWFTHIIDFLSLNDVQREEIIVNIKNNKKENVGLI